MNIRDVTNPFQLKTFLDWISRQISNNTGTVTLTANATSTTVSQNKVTPNSVITLTPATANAASALTTTYVVAGNGQFVINHSNISSVDRKFNYSIFGV